VPKRAFASKDQEHKFREMVSRHIPDHSNLKPLPAGESDYRPTSLTPPDWRWLGRQIVNKSNFNQTLSKCHNPTSRQRVDSFKPCLLEPVSPRPARFARGGDSRGFSRKDLKDPHAAAVWDSR